MLDLSIREIVASEPRLRLVKVLTENEEGINISRLVREADMNFGLAVKHLEVLEDADLVRDCHYGRIRIIVPRTDRPLYRAVKSILREMEEFERGDDPGSDPGRTHRKD